MKNINRLLLYIFLILLLYCLMYTYLYNSNELIFDSDIESNSDSDSNINRYNKYNKYDKFINVGTAGKVKYINGLNNINIGLTNSIVNNPYMDDVRTELSSINDSINTQDNITLNNLSNIYMKDYLEYINRKNALVNKEYEKFRANYIK